MKTELEMLIKSIDNGYETMKKCPRFSKEWTRVKNQIAIYMKEYYKLTKQK